MIHKRTGDIQLGKLAAKRRPTLLAGPRGTTFSAPVLGQGQLRLKPCNQFL
jgi:hypothetical protein